jgi:hypothetical protein
MSASLCDWNKATGAQRGCGRALLRVHSNSKDLVVAQFGRQDSHEAAGESVGAGCYPGTGKVPNPLSESLRVIAKLVGFGRQVGRPFT